MGEVYESPDKMFKVTTTSVMQFADYVIRTFVLRRVSDMYQLTQVCRAYSLKTVMQYLN